MREAPVVPENQSRVLRDRTQIRKPRRLIDEVDFAEYSAPKSFNEAISGPDADQWKRAIEEELRAHDKNGT